MSREGKIHGLLVALAFLSALLLRSVFSYGIVFPGDEVVFQDPDAVFHVRTIQNLVKHFPMRSGRDPYSGFPHGQNVDTGPFHDYAIGTVAWMAGLGSPSRHLTDAVAAWFPALLGALIVIPVYLLGRGLFGARVGLIAAGVLSILPGAFLWVTRLGNPDHHVSEILLSTLLLLLLVKALQLNAPWRLVVMEGVVLGCYLATQPAGAFLVVFVEIWAMLQICSNRLRGTETRLVWRVVVPPLLIGWLMFVMAGPMIWSDITTLVLFGGMIGISAAVWLSEKLDSGLHFLLALLGGLVGGVAAVALLKPDLMAAAMTMVADRGTGPARTVGELRPLLTAMGRFSFAPAWTEFTTLWFLAPIALFAIGRKALKENSAPHLLFAVWSALMMALSFQHIRNCHYLAVSMALLSGYACCYLFQLERRYERIVAGVLLGAALIVPNAAQAFPLLLADNGIRPDWKSALAFLREKTPEPFGDPGAFDRYFPYQPLSDAFAYPKSAYGVMNWWDFGHSISAYGRRIPIANGTQTGAEAAAQYFTATDPAEAAELMRKMGARYVIADSSMPIGSPKVFQPSGGSFLAMISWAKLQEQEYVVELLGGPVGEDRIAIPVFTPAYYESMLSRLYLFDGQAHVSAGSSWVIQYSEETVRGQKRKRLTGSQRFGTYEEAVRYMKEHPARNQLLGGLDPLQSCVPLPKLDRYRLVYSSQPLPVPAGEAIRAVKIYEFLR